MRRLELVRAWSISSLLAISAACSAPPPAAPPPLPALPSTSASPPDPPSPPPDSTPAPSLAPAPPPDPLAQERQAFEARLASPLLSSDGKTILLGPRVIDDGASIAYLTLLDIDRDREARAITAGAADPPDVQRARLAEARALLDTLGGSPLVAYETSADPTGRERVHGLGSSLPMAATGEGLRVRFHEPTLIADEPAGRAIFTRAFPAWSQRGPVAGERCLAYADLRRVWGRRSLGVLLVEIGYSASPHFCTFAPALHPVRIARP
ncbi:MAG: hypothetical protein U0359_07750 [Byssovorax sp.]